MYDLYITSCAVVSCYNNNNTFKHSAKKGLGSVALIFKLKYMECYFITFIDLLLYWSPVNWSELRLSIGLPFWLI